MFHVGLGGPKVDILLCKICGDRAAGRHFGVAVCDGCKGFFRRSVRNSQVYICRFERNCVVDKDKRNQCRYCRLRKCFRAGMRKEAVQNERDHIKGGRRQNSTDYTVLGSSSLTLAMLSQADMLIQQNSTYAQMLSNSATKKMATVADFYDSTKQQLLGMVEWAKYIPAFTELTMEDRMALMRGHATNNLVVGLVRRSMHLKDTLLLGNGCILTRESEDVIGVNCRIMDELVAPLQRAKMDDMEFACFKAVIFFDPTSKGVIEKEKVNAIREQALLLLEDYIIDRQQEPRGRFGKILVTLPSLRAISLRMKEEMQFRNLFGIAHVDKLLREILLGEDVTSNEDSDDMGELSFSEDVAARNSCSLSNPSVTSTSVNSDGEESHSQDQDYDSLTSPPAPTATLVAEPDADFREKYSTIISNLIK